MLVLGQKLNDDQIIRFTVGGVSFTMDVEDVRGEKVRLSFDMPDDVIVDRVRLSTGEVLVRPGKTLRTPSQFSLSDGVAEATLACTGADSPAPLPRKDAGETPLVLLGQGATARAIHARDLSNPPAVGSVLDAIA